MENLDASDLQPPSFGRRWLVFKPDHVSFGKFIMSDQMRKPVVEVADDIAARARETANRDNSNKRRVHHYADEFQVNPDAGSIKVDKAFRVKVDVYNEDPVALYNEFGNKKSKRHRTLGRAGAEFGDFHGGSAVEDGLA